MDKNQKPYNPDDVLRFGIGGDPPGGCVRRIRGRGRRVEVPIPRSGTIHTTTRLEPGPPSALNERADLSALLGGAKPKPQEQPGIPVSGAVDVQPQAHTVPQIPQQPLQAGRPVQPQMSTEEEEYVREMNLVKDEADVDAVAQKYWKRHY